jgi:sterol desaturase/sphingolipid hydroxylase (fatty acid hydroxylase superfamily)
MLDLQAMWGVYSVGIVAFFTILPAIEVGLRLPEWWASRGTANPRKLFPENGVVNLLLNLSYTLTTAAFGAALAVTVGFIAYNFSGWRIPLNWWTVPLYFLAGEFYHYFYHRLMHEVRFFWADHATHHSATEFDYSTNWRQHLFQWMPKVATIPFLTLLGFHPAGVLLFGAFISFQLFCHTSRFGTWGWWDTTFMSPSNHGIHHSRNPVYMDRNYGGFTVIWDRLLGTHASFEGERMVYGITKPVNSTNFVTVLVQEYVHMWRDFFAAPSWKLKIQVLLGRPGETFEAPAKPKAAAVSPDVLNTPLPVAAE